MSLTFLLSKTFIIVKKVRNYLNGTELSSLFSISDGSSTKTISVRGKV